MMKSKPKVSVIVTHHLNINDLYLEFCLLALMKSRGISFDVIVVSDSETKPDLSRYLKPGTIDLYWDRSLDTATKKINLAIDRLISIDSTHLMFISDDVIVSQDTISDMYLAFNGRHLIMGPMSNSDLNSRYEADLEVFGIPGDHSTRVALKPDMTLQDFTTDQLLSLMRKKRGKKLLLRTEWICFYAVMMTKEVWHHTQGYDAALEYRHNDQDFCMRASQFGIPSVINFGAFAFHFGSQTMKYVDETQRQECSQHFMRKWSRQ